MKKNKLFTLFSLTLLSMGTPLTSIAQAVAISQNTPAITTASNEETEKTQDPETKPVPTDEDQTGKAETESVITEQEKSEKQETETKDTEEPKNEKITPSEKKAIAGNPGHLKNDRLIWGDAPWSFDNTTGSLTINSGTLGQVDSAPWNRDDNEKIDAEKIKQIIFTGAILPRDDSTDLFWKLTSLTEIKGLTNMNTSEVTSTRDMFRDCTSLTSLDLSQFITKSVTDMRGMFRNCTSLKSLDLSTFDTSAVEQINQLFEDVPLVSLTLGDTFNFKGTSCSLSNPLSLFSTSELQRDGKYLTGKWIKKDNQSAAYDADSFMTLYGKVDLKAGTYVAETLSLLWGDAPYTFDSDTGSLTINAGTLDVSKYSPWNRDVLAKIAADQIKKIIFTGKTKAPVNATDLFKSLKNLTEIAGLNNLDTSDVTNMTRMFDACAALTTLDLSNFNTAKVTNMLDIFRFCTSLISLDLKTFKTKNVTDMRGMFRACSSLTSLTLGDAFRFNGDNVDFPTPAALKPGDQLTGKWIKMNRDSYPYSPADFVKEYGKNDLTAGTYVAEIKAPLLWGDAPYTFDKNTGTLTIESGRLGKRGDSPWKRSDNEKIDEQKVKKIIFTGPVLAPENSEDLFRKLTSLTEIEGLTHLDTSQTTSMLNMFCDVTSLTSLDLSQFNTKSVTDMRGVFSGCTSLKSLDLTSFDTSAVKQINQLLEDVPLVSLTLGDTFNFKGTSCSLSNPLSLFSTSELQREGSYLTGKWIKKDNQSAAYSPGKFMANYGKGDLTAGTYVAEIKSLLWGDAPYTFDSDTGTLTINPGILDKTENAPWKLTDNRKIDAEKIKKISFTGATKAPEDATGLFKSLSSNLTEIAGLTNLDTSGVTTMADMFRDCTSLTSLDLSKFNTKSVIDMKGMFGGCTSLKSLDLSSFDTSAITEMGKLFENVPLISLTLGDTFNFIGTSCSLSNPLSLFSTSELQREGKYLTGKWIKKDNQSTAYDADSFMTLYGKVDLKAGTYVAETLPLLWGDAPYTFDSDTGSLTINAGTLDKPENAPWKLTDIRKIDAEKIKKIRFTGTTKAPVNSTELFRKLTSLTEFENLTYLDTSEVTNMDKMFYDCYKLKKLDLSNFNTSKVTSIVKMFFYCISIESLDLSKFNTKNVTDMSGLFQACRKLKTLDLSGFNTLSKPKMTDMFNEKILSSLTLGNDFQFETDADLPVPAVLNAGDPLTGKWIKKNRGSYPYSPAGFMKGYGKNDLTAGTYVAEIEAPLLWGDAPYTFDKNTGTLTVESGRLGKTNDSPWNRDDNEKIDAKKIKKIIFTGAILPRDDSTDLFWKLTSLTEIKGLTNMNTSEVTSTRDMFRDCTSLTSLDLSQFITKSVTDMRGMFRNCTSLKSLDLSSFDTSAVEQINQLFEDVPLISLTLGDTFDFKGKICSLSNPLSLFSTSELQLEGKYLTGNWIKKDNQSAAYSPVKFMANYGKGDLTAGTYVAEIKPLLWGDAPYIFDSNTGVLTINSGTLGETESAPWNKTDNSKVAGEEIKKIVFTGTTKAPENAKSLFKDLDNLTEIAGLTNLDTSGVTTTADMFRDCTSLTSLDLSKFNTKSVIDMKGMFGGCTSLKSLDLSSFDTTNVIDMKGMFGGCTSLKSLDLSSFDTTNVIDMKEMFGDCTSLKNLDLSSFDTTNVINMEGMFGGCTSLKSLDLSNFDTTKVTTISDMFLSCINLETLDLSKFDTKNMTDMTGLFKSCKKLKTLDLSGFNTLNKPKMKDMFNETILSSLTLGDAFRFVGDEINLPKPAALTPGVELTGKWIKKNRGSYPLSPDSFMREYGKNELTAGTYVAEIKAPLLWGDAPWTFDKDTGTLTIESGRLGKTNDSPWNRDDDKKIDRIEVQKIIFTGAVLPRDDSTDLFRKLISLTEIKGLTYLDTSDVTNLSGMFYDCYSLKKLDLSNFNTENVTSMVRMFFFCVNLESLDLSKFNTKNVTDMSGMFFKCEKLNTLDISGFSTIKNPTMKEMFKVTYLSSLTLGTDFRFIGGADTSLSPSQSEVLREGNYLTGNWFKKDNPLLTYTTDSFTTNYGKTDDLQAGTYIAETKPLLWGDAPYAFNSSTGILTINPGTLDVSKYSPWNRDDLAKIDADQIKKIIFKGKTKAPENSNNLFANLTSLKEIVGLDKLDTSELFYGHFMFKGCTMLESLDLSNWDASNMTAYAGIFEDCKSLKKLDISSFIIPPKSNWLSAIPQIFKNCDSLASLTLGDKFVLYGTMNLPDPKALNSWEKSTGKWIRKDGNSEAYSTPDFVANYGKKNLRAGTYIAESLPNKWGEALWTFDPDTGILTVNSGKLEAGSTTSPWKRTDGQNIEASSVKQIVLTGKTQAPENSDALFSDLPNLTDIVNLTNLDTSKATSMSRMFSGCKTLKTLDLSQYDTSQVTHMAGIFQDCTSLTTLDLSSFDTGKVTTMQNLFKNTSLSSLILGEKFTSMGEDAALPIPTPSNEGEQLTGNWIRQDGKSKAYSPANFMANYGTGDLQAGTYVGEVVSSGAILETNISFSTDSGKTVTTTAVIGDQLQATLTVKHTTESPTDATANAVKLSTISLLTDAWTLSPTVTVTTFDKTGKQTASNEQTIKDNELSLPTLPHGSYSEITLNGTAWEKAYAIPSGNCNYTLSYKNQAGEQKVDKSDNFVINSGTFGFKSVPNISFKDSVLPLVSNQIIDRKDDNYAITVEDYRGARLPDGVTTKPDRVNWEITATASPFKDTTGKVIKLSTMAISYTNKLGEVKELGSTATLIASHDVTGETPKTNHLTQLSWGKEIGFKTILHNRSGLDTTKYTADIDFDLRTAP